MAGRLSNRERISRAAAEADAAAKEKAAAKKPSAGGSSRKKASSKTPGRVRVVWIVCDQSGSAVETFDYPKEQEARAEAERLTGEKGRPHFVKQGEVPFE